MMVAAVLNLLIIGIGKASATNYHGITTIVAYKFVDNVSGTQYWDAKLWSKTRDPVTFMNNIGYSWWTVRERCNGNPTNQVQPTPHDLSSSSYYAATTMKKKPCDGTRQGQSLGNHIFKKNSYDFEYLYAQDSDWVP